MQLAFYFVLLLHAPFFSLFCLLFVESCVFVSFIALFCFLILFCSIYHFGCYRLSLLILMVTLKFLPHTLAYAFYLKSLILSVFKIPS